MLHEIIEHARNDRAGNGGTDAKETEADSDSNIEKEFKKSRQKHNYNSYLSSTR